MINFLVIPAYRLPLDRYLASWGWQNRHFIQPINYPSFFKRSHFPAGIYIFTDMDRLSDRDRQLASEVWDQLKIREDIQLFNHPTKAMRRFELVRTLKEKGITSFNAHRLSADHKQFPVIVRREDDHSSVGRDLIENKQQLDECLDRLKNHNEDLSQWMMLDFIDTKAEDGIYRKYSALYLNGRIIPRHQFFSRNWLVKKVDLLDPEYLEEELNYINENPHADLLKSIFKLAHIDYGRIDYSFKDGQIQIWEINLIPHLLVCTMRKKKHRGPVHEAFDRKLTAALKELQKTDLGPSSHDNLRERFSLYYYLLKARLEDSSVKKLPNLLRKYSNRLLSRLRSFKNTLRRYGQRSIRFMKKQFK